jgi:Sulfotransferase domain
MGKIVWLASYPKSGNTWLRAFLHNYIAEPEKPYSINRLIDFSVSESNALFYQKYDARPASAYAIAEVQRMRPLVHRDFTELHPDLVFVKTHNASLSVHGVPLCTPEVTQGAIYIVRDPRDVAVSYSHYTGRSLDKIIDFMGKAQAANRGTDVQVFEMLGSWSAHVDLWTRHRNPKLLVLRYEDMLEQPQASFGKVAGFLGDQADPARLDRAIRFSAFEALQAQEAEHGYVANAADSSAPFFRRGQAGQWRAVLSSAQRLRLETDHAAMMERFGYR